jgi:hypothetical protein
MNGFYHTAILEKVPIAVKKYVNDSQNLTFPTSHFVIELLPFDYLSNQKNAFQEE